MNPKQLIEWIRKYTAIFDRVDEIAIRDCVLFYLTELDAWVDGMLKRDELLDWLMKDSDIDEAMAQMEEATDG